MRADAAAYLHDACATLAAFVQAERAIAGLLLGGSPALLAALLQVHDVALPALQGAVSAAQQRAGSSAQQQGQVCAGHRAQPGSTQAACSTS